MFVALVRLAMLQLPKFCSNPMALLNIPLIFVTLEVFQPLISLLNTNAEMNILLILVTLPVFHELRSPAKLLLLLKALCMVVTLLVSQVLTLPLKLRSLENKEYILVTLLVSQPERSGVSTPEEVKDRSKEVTKRRSGTSVATMLALEAPNNT